MSCMSCMACMACMVCIVCMYCMYDMLRYSMVWSGMYGIVWSGSGGTGRYDMVWYVCMFKHVSMFFWSFNAPHVADFPEANTFGRWLADEGRHSGQRLSFSL